MSSEQQQSHSVKDVFAVKRHSADLVFAVVMLLAIGLLLSQIPQQTKFFNGLRLFAQPAIWPVMALAGMLIFFIPYLAFAISKHRKHPNAIGPELLHWLKALEYPVWFLAYVYLVPYVGYLLATLVFCASLTWRLGYRSLKTIGIAMLSGLAVIILFKSFLQVRIPGGAIYEYLPAAIRNFMILNL